MLVQMELARILIRELNDFQVIELREVGEGDVETRRSFPIVIGLPEAQAIERRLKGVPIKRPQTHDLLANMIDAFGAKLESITIPDLNEHTYFAVLKIRRSDGELMEVDARPSDAIALGIASRAPIFVEEAVIEAASEEL